MSTTTVERTLHAQWLVYDIPERPVPPATRRFPNPSPRLRRIGIRVNLSCWVVPTGHEPWSLLNRMTAAGVTWRMVKFDASEGAKLIEMAIDAIKKEIRERMVKAARSARNAERMKPGETTPEHLKRYAKTSAGIFRRLNQLLKDFREVAGRFGIDADGTLNLADASKVVDVFSSSMAARARIVAEAAKQARGLSYDAELVGRAADEDECPWYVLADAVEEHGGDASAIRAAFSPASAA